ncbi:CPSF A subunit region-domain-containing protein [Roridomyces roridus]|uniref:CPSF A subunit region-domain-containing protein n=1 Tax=Roridomyces roridus TaxID=1738132 RepID=A0AAD7FN36_9AGAR|nr:CPSF A subunit region-domain-containing protein [Roridomyces roridus]
MHALHQQILPPSGVEFATSLKLTPSSLPIPPRGYISSGRTLCNLVVARSNLLRIFDVREEEASFASLPVDDERRRGAEPVEGEAEMDTGGDGFVNISKVSTGHKSAVAPPTVTRIYFVREHSLHGIVTGIEGIQTMASIDDKLDRLLISFKDAKIALMEWSDIVHDLVTVSIHTYERAPQLIHMDSSSFQAMLRVDPASRCAALSLPKDAIAILPFYQTQADLDVMEQEQSLIKDVPYSPSFILDLPASVDENMRNVIDFAFLPGFNNTTLAVLFQTQQTWTGRLKEYKDTVRLSIFTLDVVSQHYPVIASVTGLPHDCISMIPCSASLGGVVVLSSNSIIYIDRASRRVVLPLNGWAARISEMPMPPLPTPEDQNRNIVLEGSRAVFADERTMLVILKDGTVHPAEIVSDGQVAAKWVLGPPLARTTIPQLARKLNNELVFVGSTVGPSVVFKAARVEEEVEEDQDADQHAVAQVDEPMDVYDDDEDLYGPSKAPDPVAQGQAAKKTRTVTHLTLCDTLEAHGSIADMAFSVGWNGPDRPVPELVAATGTGELGGFTVFQRDLPTWTKRKLPAVAGTRGLWSLPIRQTLKSGTLDPLQPAYDTLIISTDAHPSPGLSRLAHRSTKNDLSISVRIPVTTIGAGPFFQGGAILQVTTNAIRILEPDGSERQGIKDMDGNMPRARIRACSISDPFVFVIREDDSIGLFIETDRGKIRRKDMSPMGEKSSRYITGGFFSDSTGLFDSCLESSSVPDSAVSADRNHQTSTLSAVSSGSRNKWLLLVRPSGVVEIWTLPKLALVFSTPALSTLQNVITDSHQPATPSPPEDPPRKPQELDIEQILIAPLGESSPKPHLFVFLRSGQLAIYEAVPGGLSEEPPTMTRASSLNLKFVKVLSKAFEIQRMDDATGEKSIIAEQKRISRQLIPFVTSRPSGQCLSGVFFTGDNPSWILGTNKSTVKIIPSGHALVHAFTACSLWESKGDFLVYSDEGPTLLEWEPDFDLDNALPSKSIPRGRSYSHVVFDPSTCLIVAASTLQAKFASFDEDNVRVWEPDAPNVSDPLCDCSCLELISPDLWITMDGFEFATNEFITAVSCVTLETSSTESGIKDFIAVGTTIDRGEDLAAKGSTYVFEIVEVVPDFSLAPKRWYKLRLRFRDDAKGPVTALCAFSGYLVSSMGQKIFVRAFDDDRLVGVAFLDVGVYVTSLRTMKNLLLIGDAVKSVTFVAFQEDPYKLVILTKNTDRVCVTNADFFFSEGEMAIVTGDEEGIFRVYEYNPSDPESRDGRYLLLRTEFHGQCEYRACTTIARRTKEETAIPQSKLILGLTDGSLKSLTVVDEATAKRLQLLQGQLTRNIQHMAGLNPKALRIVRNDHVSKPLSKGILDGNLLVNFESLPITRQNEMTREIGTERTVVLRDWAALSGAW